MSIVRRSSSQGTPLQGSSTQEDFTQGAHKGATSTELNIQELKQLLKQLLSRKISSADHEPFPYNLFVWSAPGIGKSDVMRQVCEELGLELHVLMLNQLEPSDLKGLPVVDQARQEVMYLKDRLIPRDPHARGILFLDELTTASIEVSQAALRMIYERRLDELELPPGMLIVAAGNRRIDGAFTNVTSSAMSNRFIHLELTPCVEQWAAWAQEAQVAPELIDFLKSHPYLLHKMEGDLEQGWPSPRAWEMLHKLVSDLGGFESMPRPMLRTLSVGAVGAKAGDLLLDFLETRRFWMSPEVFFERPEQRLLLDEDRPELRLHLLNEMATAFVKRLRPQDPSHAERDAQWLDGLLQRLDELSDTEAVMMLKLIAQELPKSLHDSMTHHPRFHLIITRLGIEALQFFELRGQQLIKLAQHGLISDRGVAFMRSLVSQAPERFELREAL